MSGLTAEILAEATSLIDQLRSGTLSDDEQSAIVTQLDRMLPDPDWWAYTIDSVPALTADDVVRKAFAYRPIQL